MPVGRAARGSDKGLPVVGREHSNPVASCHAPRGLGGVLVSSRDHANPDTKKPPLQAAFF